MTFSCQDAEILQSVVIGYELSQRCIGAFHQPRLATVLNFAIPHHDIVEKRVHGLGQIPLSRQLRRQSFRATSNPWPVATR